MQTLVPLTEGQLKITESKFYRISGESTQHRGVIPDVEFPSIYDTTEIGESALDHALRWDQISPVRHINYDDFSSVLPDIQTQFLERSAHNPDFIFLEDQIEMAQAAREMTALPLNEKSRIALRDTQKEKALGIENKRRKAKGEELLTSLQDDEDEDEDEHGHGHGDSHSDDPDLDPLAANEIDNDDDVDQEDEEEDVTDDVLLMEAGYVLADALLLKQRRYALHQEEETVH